MIIITKDVGKRLTVIPRSGVDSTEPRLIVLVSTQQENVTFKNNLFSSE